jgi:hypothetical protein
MDSFQVSIAELLASRDFRGIHDEIDNQLSIDDWDYIVDTLQLASEQIHHRNWLRSSKAMLALLDMSEFFGLDADIFELMKSLGHVANLNQAASVLYPNVLGLVTSQLKNGGSTLFFNAKAIAESMSAGLLTELMDARYRETLLVIEEIDGFLEISEKDWFDGSNLWRTSNGFRVLKAANMSVHISRRDYTPIRELLLRELDTDPKSVNQVCEELRSKDQGKYLILSDRLNEIIKIGIDSRGVRGQYEAVLQPRIDLEGLDDF